MNLFEIHFRKMFFITWKTKRSYKSIVLVYLFTKIDNNLTKHLLVSGNLHFCSIVNPQTNKIDQMWLRRRPQDIWKAY